MNRLPYTNVPPQTLTPLHTSKLEEPMTDSVDPSDLEDQAIEMLVHLHSGRATTADHLAYDNWCQRSAFHAHAASRAEALWGAFPLTQKARQFVAPPPEKRRKPVRALWAAGMAACVALVVFSAALQRPWSALYADHVTDPGERRELRLEDGSRLWMNGDTVLSVNYSHNQRGITLYQGEALFEVAKDSSRPFIVHAAQGDVQAIGTRFDVDQRGDKVTVQVSEGIVQLSSGGETLRLPAGQSTAYRQGLAPQMAVEVDVQDVATWQRGKLIFNARPLGEVLAELDRYIPGVLYLTDETLAARRISGTFEVDDPHAALNALEQTQPLRITRLPLLTLVRPKR
ncbi:FecR family protein [Pseudomonas sp. B21-032]|uniref:FecR family protein n=1 Tax=Pseudomonas sp. B21-032 TaxID=2895483 RepID=UPI0021604D4C|nr:FecR family protein [Pseudomonas sp. B21-032]UVL63630.1 FecR family protein [Pseudomonas sp. B21-032]